MQAIHGKIRLIGRLTINNFKNVDLKRAVWDSAVTSSSTHFGSNPLWLQLKEFGTETGFLMSFKNNGMSKGEKSWTGPAPCLSQSVRLVPTNRCFSTIGNSVESAPQDASVTTSNIPTRIKFKRLDKTARHIMQILDKEAVEEVKSKREIPEIKPGYMVQLKVEVPENKRRVSVIKGIVIARRNSGISTTFRLRRLVAGVGVESLYQLYSPNIKEIKVLDKKKVRRAKLYYLRDKMNALKK
ncbi:50S ribosomal protein L19, chloroplastic-like [Coffea eugenioides]|uniref:50S ribosomal protein L19, chloroplastic-like n=1 Tax=Coffea eugenioides TaxID=49369 RepID=UPI000F60E113|nr:50S ribosomal protein L19, chloroplastic-like [Coffea eugenioides]XP_027168500.1 50S ribosomal protein L19, chloroplastic-like [Coffea eugenioides]XP_027168501.1 50S ribosomal protein L19, chloroplastic-like [Coffea eugenioides]XP_027168502.1 50S ribosomal protein L19, chloroplastic-like [Coffea eugenioides]XP_027168503.1 50S ribosomal protein L19, chloroplastic-like [Coffea eugenioides]